jgi:hypothetical protein
LGDRRWIIVAVLAGVPIALAAVGALAARPVADDYWFQANLTSAGDPLGAFTLGIRTWSAFYSMYALLTAGAAAGRTAGFAVAYPLASLLLLALLVRGCASAARLWFREVAVSAPVLPGALLLSGAVLASLATFRYPDAPVLFGALYWQSAWVPHLVPVLVLPMILPIILRQRVGPSLRPGCILLGVVLAGFSFGPASVSLIMATMFWWVVHQLRGAAASRAAFRGLVNFAVGIAVGTATVFLLPGTSVRQAAIAAQRHDVGAFAATAREVAASSLFTPAIVVALLAGFLLRRLAAPYPADNAEVRSVRTIRRALGAGLVLSWVPISVGSFLSYLGFWHWWPLMVLWTAYCATVGWSLAARLHNERAEEARAPGQRRLASSGTTGLALAVVVVWSGLAAGYSASATWLRRAPFDQNIHAAEAALGRSPAATIDWVALPLPYLDDVRAGAPESWTNANVARWLGVDPDALAVVGVKLPNTTVPVLGSLLAPPGAGN